jgi:hypothetical protein
MNVIRTVVPTDLPGDIGSQSRSGREIVLPLALALKAIDFLEGTGARILGWEAWIELNGQLGHPRDVQGTASVPEDRTEAILFCRKTIAAAAAEWEMRSSASLGNLLFCITAESSDSSQGRKNAG